MTTSPPDPMSAGTSAAGGTSAPGGMSAPGGGLVAFADLTARARIREAALRHFAEEGYQGATIRAIAGTAGVSPGLLRHHFGSKEELRAACE
jgi:AcrR family transcriptional regulator